MAIFPRCRGQAFFDGANPVLFCRNALWLMAAPSVSRQSRQRQGVIPLEDKETAALISQNRHKCVNMIERKKRPAPATFFFFPR